MAGAGRSWVCFPAEKEICLINVYSYTNICTNKWCNIKINIRITPTCFAVNTPFSDSLQLC